MADIVDILRLEIDDALRDIGRVEQALDRALAPVEVDIEVDERALAELENTLHEVQRIADRAATETQSIALAAGRAEVNFEDLARAMGITEAEARDLTAELLDAQAASNRLEDSARDVARQLGLSESEANRLTTSLRQADRAAEAIDVSTAGMVARFGGLRTAAAGVAGAFAAIGGVALFGGALRGAQSAITQFAALNESINAVRVTFGTASDAVFEFGESSAQSAGLSAQAFQQAVVPIGAVLTNFGFSAREAADASIDLVQRAADLASVFNTDVNEALLAINSALVGQVEPLRRYGAEISAARVEAFALANGLLVAGEEMDTATAIQARFGLILSDTNRVAGDFVNTSDEYANASRIAAAEVEKLQANIGEALLPAFEAILAQAPAVIAFFDSLIPQLATTAENAAAAGAGLAGFVSAVTLGFGQLGDIGGGVFDVLQAFPAVFEDIAAGVIDGDASFKNFRAQFDQFSQRTAQTFIRTASQSIPQAIARGDDAVTAFGNAIAFLGRQDDNLNTIQQAFDRLRRVAGLTDEETRTATIALIDQADVLRLNADEVAFLNDQLDILNNNLTVVGTEVSTAALAMSGMFDPDIVTRFTTFVGGVEDGSDRATTALEELAASAERQQARTAAAFNLFEDLPEDISQSFTEAVNVLREQVESISDFEINLAILEALDLDALADDFREKGIAAAGQLADAVNNIPLAIEADELLEGVGVIGEEAFDALVTRFISAGLDPADARELAEKLSSPQVIAAAQEAGKSVGAAQAGAYHDSLTEELDQLIPDVGVEIGRSIETHWRLEAEANDAATETANSFLAGIQASITPSAIESVLDLFGIELDLTDIGIAAGGTLMGGIVVGVSSPAAVDRLRDSIVDATNNALENRSPSHLMMRIGEDAGDAFWMGFNQADLTLRTALPAITGGIATGTSVPGIGAGVNVNINLDHASLQDPVSDVARMAQIAGSVAQTFNAVRN